jgi:hypothetical protein
MRVQLHYSVLIACTIVTAACNNAAVFGNACTASPNLGSGLKKPPQAGGGAPSDSLKKLAGIGAEAMVSGTAPAKRPSAADEPQSRTPAKDVVRSDSLHHYPPDVKTFADSNKWCTAIVPEYQDAQRFVQTGQGAAVAGQTYGPIAQSLSNPALADLLHTKQFEDSLINVAVIYVWGHDLLAGMPYSKLHLVEGLNCVFLKHDASGWSARVVVAENYKCRRSSADAATTVIAVAAEDSTEKAGSIPPVTRFVQDLDKATYLGVRCGALWCNIGATPGQVPVSITSSLPNVPAAIRESPQIRIKGWFDEQQLAVDDASRTPPLMPGKFAAVVPVPNLGDLKVWQFGMGYHKVAYVYMSDSVPKYVRGFGFTKGWNQIELTGNAISAQWFARITDATGRVRTRHVDWTPHTVGAIPGTVRWDWLENDEWIWISCDVGCCLIRAGRDYEEE